MHQRFSSELQDRIQWRKWKQRWYILFFLFACLVVVFVLHLLTFPAVSMTKDETEEQTPEVLDTAFLENACSYFYEDDQLSATVLLPEGTSVPEDAVLTVTPVEDTEDIYATAAEQIADGEIQQVKLYDVSFYTADGTYIPVSDAAKVSFHFKETVPIENQNQVAVLHFEEDGVQQPEITDVSVQENNQMTDISFDTEGFSLYAMVTWTEDLNLDGQSYAIVNINGDKSKTHLNAAIMGSIANNNNALASASCSVMNVDSKYYASSNQPITEWHFEKYDSGYAIWSGTEEHKQYINTKSEQSDGNGTLTLSNTPEAFIIEKDATGKYAGQVRIHNAHDYAINWYGGGANWKLYFGLWKEAAKDRPSNNDYMILATPMETSMLLFDVNLPKNILGSDVYETGTPWINGVPTTPAMGTDITCLNDQPDGYTEGLGAAGKLYQEKYGADAENPYTKLYRYHIIDDYSFTNKNNSSHYLNDFDYYKEIRFVGWSYTDSNGTKHIFDPKAPIARQEDDTYRITDQSGAEVDVPNGTTFYGEWEQVSSPVEFFICYGGTILDTEGDVAARRDNYKDLFTNCAAVGTLLYGDLTVGSSDLYANEPHEKITAMITTAQDLDFDSKEPQIVLETLTDYVEQDRTVYYNIKNHGANFAMLQESLLHWIRNDDNMVICLSTGDGNVQINNELATPENYQVRWYVLKDQKDGWHVDGVLTATTEEMTITKSFRNLNEDQVTSLLENAEKPYVINITSKTPKRTLQPGTPGTHGNPYLGAPEKDENGNIIYEYHTYMYLKTTPIDGQYTYQGSYDAATKTYTCIWTVRVLNGEKYVINEENYQYDPETYNVTSSTTIDNNPKTQRFEAIAGRETEDQPKEYEITGGSTQLVSFSNLYSPAKTATLTILKTNADTGLTMNGICFDLTPIDENDHPISDSKPIEVVTNANGYASFTGLTVGSRYLLTEDAKSDYFKPNTNKMIVTVTKTEDNDIPTITVTETAQDGTVRTYTNAAGTPILVYSVQNYLSDSTGVITKDFENITSSEILKILNNGYQVVIKDIETGNVVTTLTKDNAVRVSSDYKQLIWYVSGLIEGRTYAVTEEHYQSTSKDYPNVTVTAQRSDFNKLPTEIPVTVTRTGAAKTASITMTKSNTHEWAGLINSYSKTYTLKLRKVDSVTEKPLQGAVFALYGKHEEATDPSRIVRYTKPDGSVVVLYYIKDAAPTGADGYTTIDDLNFSNTEKSYIYVLQETTVPDDYVAPIDISSEQVLEVTPDQIGNGTYTLSMKNTVKTESLTIRKFVAEPLLAQDSDYAIHLKITDTVNPAQGIKKYPFSYCILNADGTTAATGTLEEGTESIIKIKADQQIKVQEVPIHFTYTVTEEITDSSGKTLYRPCITTADGSVWSNTMTGSIQKEEAQFAQNWMDIKNYPADAVQTEKDITVQKQWDDTAEHSAVTVSLYQMQTNRETGASTTILCDTQTLNNDNQWRYTWKKMPQRDDTNDYSYYVREAAVDGYDPSYRTESTELMLTKCMVDGAEVLAAPVDWEKATVTILNRKRPVLPNTGGNGTTWYPVIGSLLVLLAGVGIVFLRKRRHSKEMK